MSPEQSLAHPASQKAANAGKARRGIRQEFIEQHLALWRLSRGSAARDAILREVSDFIWHYPGFAFRVDDEDRRGDFYVIILEKFDRIIEGYDERRFPFTTWLGACLRNTWLNYATRGRDPKCDSLDAREELGEELADGAGGAALPAPENDDLSFRSGFQRLAVRLYHLDLFDEDDFALLVRATGKPLSQCAAFIEELLETVRLRRARQAHFENRLGQLFQRILRGQQAMENLRANGQAGSEAEGRLREAEGEWRRRQGAYLAEYRRVKVHPSASRIADFLGIPESRVRYWLQAARSYWGPERSADAHGLRLAESSRGPRGASHAHPSQISAGAEGGPAYGGKP
ncbi:MAG: hypothetical protein J0L75_16505 [Spirochaetes bacterium]|nr:hypothetical protein [Spirochaetota bacterium]